MVERSTVSCKDQCDGEGLVALERDQRLEVDTYTNLTDYIGLVTHFCVPIRHTDSG